MMLASRLGCPLSLKTPNMGNPGLGDTADKLMYLDEEKLGELGVTLTEHDKLPDVVLYDEERNWLFLVEAVTSHGPVSPKRIRELEVTLRDCVATRVYVGDKFLGPRENPV